MKMKRTRRTRATSVEPAAIPSERLPADVAEDRLLGGSLIVRQPKRGHRAGTDAVLLASAAPALQAKTIVDLGSGVGTVGLIIAARFPKTRLTLVDKDPALVALARDNELFVGSIAENIHVGRTDIPSEALHDALEEVGLIEDVLTAPHGLETVLSTGGLPLLGHQRTKLLIARAIAGRPVALRFVYRPPA